MNNTTRIWPIATISCFLLTLQVNSQEPDSHVADPTHLKGMEHEVRMLEAELELAQLAVEEVKIEQEKAKQHAEVVKRQGDTVASAFADLECKQATIRTKMRMVRSEMVRLQLEHGQSNLERMRKRSEKKASIRSPVTFEFVDDLDVVVIRGKKADVDRIKSMLENQNPALAKEKAKLQIKVFSLTYGEADDLAKQLRELFPGETSESVRLTCDPRTNSIVAQGPPQQLAVIEAILMRLDQKE